MNEQKRLGAQFQTQAEARMRIEVSAAEQAAFLASLRNDALEEAAKVCETLAERHANVASFLCADAIRALKTPQP